LKTRRSAVVLIALWIAVLAAAAALRLADLGNRTMHCDEAGHAVKFGRLLEQGEYVYDPREYHGPSLNDLTLPVAWAASAGKLTQVTETQLRLVPALFGIMLVVLVWLVRDELGRAAALWAAALTAVSPAMVFYSRYYIQEMLLVTFTLGAIVALWRYARTIAPPERPWLRQTFWLVVLGLCVGLMHATKETCVIALAAIAIAAAVAMGPLRRAGARRLLLAGLVVVPVAAVISALLFSSFGHHPRGVLDSYAAYFHYLGRASGEGSAGPQDHPPYYYFQVLFWWHRPGGGFWTEGAIAVLAPVGAVAAVLRKGIEPLHVPMARFLAVYTVLVTVIYSAMPYKTPWCALGFLDGMILLAGVGAAVLVRAAGKRAWSIPFVVAIALPAAAIGHLAWEAHRASFAACDDPTNPYLYAPTTRDVLALVRQVDEIAAAHPDGRAMHVQVIAADDDYWPLPWYLRGLTQVGWFRRMPQGPPAPLIITQPAMERQLAQYLYEDQPPGQRNLYVPLPAKPDGTDWQLRPGVPLRVYARRDLWEAHQAGEKLESP
jgi:uncharacterized protein (TIGR03663 family)